jgi:hypothetical protein
LTVIRVSSSVWQAAVKRLGELSSTILVDVSDPTENLVWEIDSMKKARKRFVVICEFRRVQDIVGATPSSGLHGRLAALLRDERVLTYSTDADGRTRFGLALRDAL